MTELDDEKLKGRKTKTEEANTMQTWETKYWCIIVPEN